MQRVLLKSLVLFSLGLLLSGCGGGNSAPAGRVVHIAVTPTQISVTAGTQFPFQAAVQGSTDTAVNWLVNGVPGGDTVHGTISATGVYTAPALVPTPASVTIAATAHADATKSAAAQATVQIGVTIAPNLASMYVRSAGCPVVRQFTATVAGTTNSNVVWRVNGLAAGDPDVVFGSIDAAGLYTAPDAIPNPGKFCVTANSEADPTQSGTANISISAGGATVDQVHQNFPISLGTSGGNATDKISGSCCSGTLGALVTRNGQNYILSNNHVLARNDQAVVGESVTQPGLVDNRCLAGGAVANYSEAVPLRNSSNIAFADAALAEIIPGKVDPSGSILQLGEVNCGLAQPAPPATNQVLAEIGMPVAKSGRSTGLTCANITDIAVDGVQVEYHDSCGSNSTFNVSLSNQIIVESPTFSDSGDSGALIVKSDTAEPTALLFAGDATTGITVGNPIQDVLLLLKDPSNQAVPSIVGGDPHPVVACAGSTSLMSFKQPTTTQQLAIAEKAMSRAKTIKTNHLKEFTADPAVTGVGIGAGEKSGEMAIVIFVQQGKSHKLIPSSVEGVPVRIKTIGPIRAFGELSCDASSNSLWPAAASH